MTWIMIKLFLGKYWKYIAVVLAIAGLVFSVYSYLGNIKEAAYNKGVVVTNNTWNKRIEQENEKNRELEASIAAMLEDFAGDIIAETSKRNTDSVVIKDHISTIIKDNPIYSQCIVDQEVVDNRNAIRAFGPSTVTNKADGSVRIDFNEK